MYELEDFEYGRTEQPYQTAPRRHRRKKRHPLRGFVVVLTLCMVAFAGMGLYRVAAAGLDGLRMWELRQDVDCPQELLDALEKNEEMLSFVKDYPKHHQDAPANALSESLDTVPLLLQWDERWGYQQYGSSMIALSGCAPTCVAMAAAYLTKDPNITPYSVAQYAEQHGYYVPGAGTSWELLRTGTQEFGMMTKELPLAEKQINAALDAGNPVICSMKPGDFTTTGHFIVLYGRENDGYLVRDPNSIERSEKTWPYETLSGQINNLWACAAA